MTTSQLEGIFSLDEGYLKYIEIVYVDHDASYEESIHVLFIRDGKLYEVVDSHCSCNEFEWDEDETSLAALRKQNICSKEYHSALDRIQERFGGI